MAYATVGVWMRRGLGCGMLAFGAMLVLAVPAGAQGVDSPVTFTKDIAPILQEKCQACHREGYMAPMSLMTYRESRPWARAIKARVVDRQMPPWHIDRSIGIQ